MKFKIPPYKHQLELLARVEKERDHALLWGMGCISGQAVVKINRGGASREYTLAEAYARFHNTWSRSIPTRIRSFKGDHIGLNTVRDILYQGVKEVFKVTLQSGHTVKATADHEFLTDVGFVRLDALGKYKVCIDTLVKHQKKKKRKVRVKPRYNLLTVGPYHPYGHETRTRHRKKIRRVEKHRLIMEAHLNGLSLVEYILATYQGNRKLRFIDPKTHHVHHRDGDVKNNVIENLEVLTAEEHFRHHGNYKHFSHGEPSYSGVRDITPAGHEEVYDIVCSDPHRNFVVNGIVVHNCGKTGGMINVLRYHYGKVGRVRRTLILSPLVTLFNWRNEFELHSNIDLSLVIPLHQGGSKNAGLANKLLMNTKTLQYDQGRILITNYESLQNEKFMDILLAWRPEILVCDEVHYCKNPSAKRSKAVVKLADRADHRFILTGTPILNNVKDIFMQYRILDGGETFGKNYAVFMNKYMEDANRQWSGKPGWFPKWEPRVDMFDELHNKIYAKSSRVTLGDCVDMPPLVRQQRVVELSAEQKKYYESMRRDFIAFVDEQQGGGAVVAQLAMTKALRLQQIVCGVLSTEEGQEIILENTPRLAAVEELLEELTPDHKVILWCSFRANYKQLGNLCTRMGIDHVFLTGEMGLKEKQDAMDRFDSVDSCRAIIANRRAGGIGVNLVAASYSIVVSRNFSLGDELQSEARNYRGGSQRHGRIVKIDLVARDTIDEHVLKALSNKQEISDTIIDTIRGGRK